MHELSRRTHGRILTDMAFAATLAAAAAFGMAVAGAQSNTPSQQNDPAPDKLKTMEKTTDGAPSLGETRAAPAPQLPADKMQPPVSGRPLDQPDKALHSAPPEKIEGK